MLYPLVPPLLLLPTLLAASGLGVTANAPDVDCPSSAEVTQAIARRLPAGTVAGDADWQLRYGWEGTPPARAVGFRLLAPDGTPALERRFPLLAHECVAAAATMAVIVERYFRDLGWTAGATLPPVAGSRVPAATGPGPEVLRLAVGAAFRTGGSPGAAAAVSARVHLVGPLHLGAALLIPSASHTERLVLGGQARADEWQTRFFTWASFMSGRVEWGAGLDALASFQSASSSGIANPAHKDRTMLALGLGAGPCYHWGRRWRVALELSVYRALPATTFYVTENGVDGDVLKPPPWRFLGTLSIGYVLID